MKRAAVLIFGLLAGVLVLAAACGGGDDDEPTPRPRATVAQATTSPTATTAAEPTAAPTTPSTAETVTLAIGVNGDALEFDSSSFSVSSGMEVTISISNSSGINQHNWVLVKAGTKDAVSTRGTSHPTTDWLEPGDADVIASTKLVDPGATGQVSFTAPSPGTYQFVCTFPGHNITMFGDFEVTG